jgi:multidrug resistance efflux pump
MNNFGSLAMNDASRDSDTHTLAAERLDSGLAAIALIANYYRIAADSAQLRHQLEKSQAQLASDEGQLIETDATLKEVQGERAKAISQFIADNQNRLADASRKADEARQALAKAVARLARTKPTAPIDGVVQRTAVTTVGQVVTTGQQLAVITPAGGKLQVEALIANLDIGFIKAGQDAVIKVDAFPFTRFGVLHGKVIKIASGAIAEQEAKRGQLVGERSGVPRRKEFRARSAHSCIALQHGGPHGLRNPFLPMERAHESADDASIRVGVSATRQRLAQRLDERGP